MRIIVNDFYRTRIVIQNSHFKVNDTKREREWERGRAMVQNNMHLARKNGGIAFVIQFTHRGHFNPILGILFVDGYGYGLMQNMYIVYMFRKLKNCRVLKCSRFNYSCSGLSFPWSFVELMKLLLCIPFLLSFSSFWKDHAINSTLIIMMIEIFSFFLSFQILLLKSSTYIIRFDAFCVGCSYFFSTFPCVKNVLLRLIDSANKREKYIH